MFLLLAKIKDGVASTSNLMLLGHGSSHHLPPVSFLKILNLISHI